MAKGTVYRERTSYLFSFLSILLVAVGVALVRVAESLPGWGWPSWQPVASNLGGLVIASVGLGALWELRGRRAFVEEIFETASVAEQVQSAKVLGVSTEFMNGVEWAKLLDASRELDLLVARGRTWCNAHDHSLRALLAKPGAKVNVILPDPANGVVVGELSRRFGYDEGVIVHSIRETEDFFKEIADKGSARKGSLRIWYLSAAPLYTFYRMDNVYVLTTYRHGGRGRIPTIVCHKGGLLADFVDEQFAFLTAEKSGPARLVYSHREALAKADAPPPVETLVARVVEAAQEQLPGPG